MDPPPTFFLHQSVRECKDRWGVNIDTETVVKFTDRAVSSVVVVVADCFGAGSVCTVMGFTFGRNAERVCA